MERPNIAQLLSDCQEQEIQLYVTPIGKLKVSASAPIPEAIDIQLSSHKAAILEALCSSPFINDRGELIIPTNCHPRFRWWNGGQSIRETLREIGAPPEVVARYVETDLSIEQ